MDANPSDGCKPLCRRTDRRGITSCHEDVLIENPRLVLSFDNKTEEVVRNQR